MKYNRVLSAAKQLWQQKMKNRLWFNIFLRVGLIFAAFVLILTVANSTLLVRFFTFRQKNQLVAQISRVAKLNLNDDSAVSEMLTDINDTYRFETEIYNNRGTILYTTHGSQMMDFILLDRNDFSMSHEELITQKQHFLSDGIVFEEAVRRFDNSEFLLCRKEISNGIFAELRIQRQLITASAQTASEFIMIVSAFCFLLSVIWILLFAKKFSKPLSQMNEITHDLAKLNFNRTLSVNRNDEIGELADSINEMSASLSKALDELKNANAGLRDEIEAERRLDVMRKAFVANVSHELKTPISIISGYAEGLKLDINSASRVSYCDTIIEESKRMNKLVLSILELSRYESGQIPLRCENFLIGNLANEILNHIFSGKEITANCEIPTDLLIYADPIQTEQVLKAYLENAAAHTPKNGNVTVKADQTEDKKIRISVFNTGSFVDENIMPQIWQSFFRGDASHKRDESRFGLGLSIVNAIMKEHGCDCGVFNTNDGVCFWFDAMPEQPN